MPSLRRLALPLAPATAALTLSGLVGCELDPSQGRVQGVNPTSAMSTEVVRVIDGDTVAVRPTQELAGVAGAGEEEYVVRLLSIDSPEMHHTDERDPDCGAREATDRLAALLPAATPVLVELDGRSDRVDRYGRVLAYVSVNDLDINRSLVADGLAEAWYPSGEPRPARFGEYREVERAAKASGAGSWSMCGSLGR